MIALVQTQLLAPDQQICNESNLTVSMTAGVQLYVPTSTAVLQERGAHM